MRAIQTFLVLMAILIGIGFIVIGVEIYNRANDPDHPRAFGRETGPDTLAADDRGTVTLEAGGIIGEVQALSSTRVIYLFGRADGSQEIHQLNPITGEVQVLVRNPGPGTVPPAQPTATIPTPDATAGGTP